MNKDLIEILNKCIELLLEDGKNTKFEVAKILNKLIKSEIIGDE